MPSLVNYVKKNKDRRGEYKWRKTKKTSLQTLVDKNYIKAIKDYSDNECDLEKSYVQIFKYSQDDYSYLAYLECPSYNSMEQITKSSSVITIEMTDKDIVDDAEAKK